MSHPVARTLDRSSHVSACLDAAVEYLFQRQRPDHHWHAELLSDPSTTAQYVFLHQMLNKDLGKKRDEIARWILTRQKPDGSYGFCPDYPGHLSVTCETYLALKILGFDASHPAQAKAREFILKQGGLAKVRTFTRIYYAQFGLYDWEAIPALPAEFMLLPNWLPMNIYALASWARATVAPLLIIGHHRPVFALPNGRSATNTFTDELWLDPTHKNIPYLPPVTDILKGGSAWSAFFYAADRLLKAYEPWHLRPLRRLALKRITAWLMEHQEPQGDWVGYWPPGFNSVMALFLQGYGLDTQPIQLGLAAAERYTWRDDIGLRLQICESSVWDTLLAVISLCDAGAPTDDPRMVGAAQWIFDRQVTERRGDWAITRPRLQPGGWSFGFYNTWYPDVDDTAAAILALVKQDRTRTGDARIHRGIAWMVGMQNRDGGWGAFDADSNKLFLNAHPVADMKAMADPSTSDVTGHVVQALSHLLHCNAEVGGLPTDLLQRMEDACRKGVRFLEADQKPFGAWWGRWGVNYIYGTYHALCGLGRLPWPGPKATIAHGLQWLKSVQNADGGWGENLASYDDPALAGKGNSTASQTAWALMGLLAHLPPEDPAITAGVNWLVQTQVPAQGNARTWNEPQTTGTGFPQHIALRYDNYRHIFPMMALGRYLQARRI